MGEKCNYLNESSTLYQSILHASTVIVYACASMLQHIVFEYTLCRLSVFRARMVSFHDNKIELNLNLE